MVAAMMIFGEGRVPVPNFFFVVDKVFCFYSGTPGRPKFGTSSESDTVKNNGRGLIKVATCSFYNRKP